MKYLILGVNGMAGHMLAAWLREHGEGVIGFAKSPSRICETIMGDARDEAAVHRALESSSADVVVNAIGILNKAVDCNMAAGIYLNSYLPQMLAEACERLRKKFVHISTDCVFSGTSGGYTESSVPDETSPYGRTKCLGETTMGNALSLRTSIIGPELKKSGSGLFHWFMSQRGEVSGYCRVLWSGVTTLELSRAVREAVQQDVKGLYHLTNGEKVSKYELLSLFNEYCRTEESRVRIQPLNEPISDKTLLTNRRDFDYQVPKYSQMVQDMAMWMRGHSDLYKQYLEVMS